MRGPTAVLVDDRSIDDGQNRCITIGSRLRYIRDIIVIAFFVSGTHTVVPT